MNEKVHRMVRNNASIEKMRLGMVMEFEGESTTRLPASGQANRGVGHPGVGNKPTQASFYVGARRSRKRKRVALIGDRRFKIPQNLKCIEINALKSNDHRVPSFPEPLLTSHFIHTRLR